MTIYAQGVIHGYSKKRKYFGSLPFWVHGSMCLQGEKYCLFRMLLDSTSKGRKMFLIVESNIVMGYITQP